MPGLSPASSEIDAHLAATTPDRRAALDRLRRLIRAAAPDAVECISYGLPAFRLPGGVVAGFAATSRGCSYFPFSGQTLAALAGDLEGFGGTPGSLHVSPARPLSPAVVRKLVKTRRAEIEAKLASGSGAKARATQQASARAGTKEKPGKGTAPRTGRRARAG